MFLPLTGSALYRQSCVCKLLINEDNDDEDDDDDDDDYECNQSQRASSTIFQRRFSCCQYLVVQCKFN